MNKVLKGLVAVAATAAMAVAGFAGASTAMADNSVAATPKITIENASDGHTYEAYQIFKGTISGSSLTGITWGSNVSSEGQTALGDAADKAASLTNQNADQFAKDVAQYLTGDAAATANAKNESGNYVLDLSTAGTGYYLVKDKDNTAPNTDAYTAYILKVAGAVTATPKADVPSVEKKVKENTKADGETAYGPGYNDVADYNIGDTVPFSLIGTIPIHRTDYPKYSYTFHDEVSAGLSIDTSSIKVYLVSAKSETTGTDVTSSFEANTTADGFTLNCTNINDLAGITGATYIRVNYNATLNENANIGLPGNKNDVYLTFSNNPHADYSGEKHPEGGESPKDYVVVFTYELDANKVDSANQTKKLSGAEFQLQRVSDSKWMAKSDGKISWVTEQSKAYTATSDTQGDFGFSGLDAGEYKLYETKAPNNYVTPTEPFTFTITATTTNGQNWAGGSDDETSKTALTGLTITRNGSSTNGDTTTGAVSMTIGNTSTSNLPSTGGMGTVLLYVAGIAVFVLAGATLVMALRRRNA